MRYQITIIGRAQIQDLTNGGSIKAPVPYLIISDAVQVNGSYEWYDEFEKIRYRVSADDVSNAEVI